jgi:hypothetical protein
VKSQLGAYGLLQPPQAGLTPNAIGLPFYSFNSLSTNRQLYCPLTGSESAQLDRDWQIEAMVCISSVASFPILHCFFEDHYFNSPLVFDLVIGAREPQLAAGRIQMRNYD